MKRSRAGFQQTRRYSQLSLLSQASGIPSVMPMANAATEFGKILNPLTAKKLLPGYYFAVYKGGEKVFERTEGLADDQYRRWRKHLVRRRVDVKANHALALLA